MRKISIMLIFTLLLVIGNSCDPYIRLKKKEANKILLLPKPVTPFIFK